MILITAFQRSGTTALGEQIGAARDFAYWGEVFHPEGYVGQERALALRLRPSANFFRVLEEGEPGLRTGPPSEQRQAAIWKQYVERLGVLSPGRRPVIDVKYNSLHNLQPVWSPPGARPLLLDLVRLTGGVVVHLVRRDTLAQILSEIFAYESDVWHREAGQTADLDAFRFQADPDELVSRLRESSRQTAMVRAWLGDDPVAELVYEDAFTPEGALTDQARAGLSAVGVDLTALQRPPVLRRTGQSPRRWLSNADAVARHLDDTEFADLARRSLG